MSPRVSMRYREPVVDERTLAKAEEDWAEVAVFQSGASFLRDRIDVDRSLYVERANTDHTPEHDAWDAGGYCNALCVDEDGSAYDCGYNRREEFELLAAEAAERTIVDVWPAPGRWALRIEYEPEPLVQSASFPVGDIAGRVGCPECHGTGWWGYGPTSAECGSCVDCKGTGRVWVGL